MGEMAVSDPMVQPGNSERRETAAAYQMGVLLRPADALAPGASGAQGSVGQFQSASGGGSRTRAWAVAAGDAALSAAGDAIAGQVATIAGRVASELASSPIGGGDPGQLAVETVEIAFGLMFTASGGKFMEALLTAGGEATVQVSVTLSRRPE